MTDVLRDIHGTPVFLCAAEGKKLHSERDATDLIGAALHSGAVWVAVPADRFDSDFFRLRTRVAGEIIQKFINYRLRIAIVGDISRHTAISTALQDFLRESNRGTHIWFVPNMDVLSERLANLPTRQLSEDLAPNR